MLASDENRMLIPWLCFLSMQHEHEMPTFLPLIVSNGLVARGWIRADTEPDYDGHTFAEITESGRAIVDVHGPDFAINTLPTEHK